MIKTWTTDTASDGTKKSGYRRSALSLRLSDGPACLGHGQVCLDHGQVRGRIRSGSRFGGLHLAMLILVTFGFSFTLACTNAQSAPQADSSNSVDTTTNKTEPVKTEARLRGYDDLPQPSAGTAARPSEKPLSAIIGREVDFDIYPGRAPSKQMKALHVKVQNRSDEPLVFDGDHSLIASKENGSQIAICITQMQLDSVGRPPTTFSGRLSSDLKATVTAAATVGAVQTAETLKKQYGPITKRYEWDEERRQNEESRFGRRLLYPGDSTDGNIYFRVGTQFSGNTLTMPVKSFYDGSDQASLSKPIPVSD
jgi:hypothetical protein